MILIRFLNYLGLYPVSSDFFGQTLRYEAHRPRYLTLKECTVNLSSEREKKVIRVIRKI